MFAKYKFHNCFFYSVRNCFDISVKMNAEILQKLSKATFQYENFI